MFEGTERQGGATMSFVLPGRVIGKNFVIMKYGKADDAARGIKADPQAEKYIKEIERAAQIAAIQQGWVVPDSDIPVDVQIIARIGIPRSWPRQKKYRLLGDYCAGKPDDDNIENCVFDGLVGALLKPDASPGARDVRRSKRSNPVLPDDSNIADNRTQKFWTLTDQDRLEVTVTILGRPPTEEVFE